MPKQSGKTEKSVEQRFPDPKARRAADAAINMIDTHETMKVYIDVWIAAYIAAGGKTSFKFD